MNRLSIALFLAALPIVPVASAHDDGEVVIVVGRDALGQIQVDTGPQPIELDPSVYPGITGYATGSVGVHSTVFDDPDHDFFQISTAADFRLILVAKDPGMEIYTGPGTYMAVGDSYYVGPPPFDTHPLWNLVTGVEGTAYALTMKFHDLNGIYPDSTPFTVSFTPEPAERYLSLNLDDPTHPRLTWSTNAVNWVLESAAGLNETNWYAVTNTPTVTGTNFSLSLTTTVSQQFFRLHLP